ncbi:MAG: group III truncated hemoglobin [Acidimicrobiales bacterium]
MSGTRPAEHRGRDLDTPAEVAELVTRFYREIAQEARFHRYFGELASVDWSVHTKVLTEYWCGLLFGGEHDDAATVIEAHRWLHDRAPFDTELFELWLEILRTTLEGGWSGPMAELAMRRGRGIAWAMATRFGAGAIRPG